MKDILDEAIYDYKEENKLKRLKKFLISVIILGLMGVIFLFIYGYYSDKSIKETYLYTKKLLDLSTEDYTTQDKKYIDQIDLLIKQQNKKIQELALLDVSAKYIKEGNTKESFKKFNIIINTEYSESVKKIAMISMFGMILDKPEKFDLSKEDRDFVNNFLKGFNNKSEIFYGKALLYKSLWYINQGDIEKSKQILNELQVSDNISQADRSIADCILSDLEVKL